MQSNRTPAAAVLAAGPADGGLLARSLAGALPDGAGPPVAVAGLAVERLVHRQHPLAGGRDGHGQGLGGDDLLHARADDGVHHVARLPTTPDAGFGHPLLQGVALPAGTVVLALGGAGAREEVGELLGRRLGRPVADDARAVGAVRVGTAGEVRRVDLDARGGGNGRNCLGQVRLHGAALHSNEKALLYAPRAAAEKIQKLAQKVKVLGLIENRTKLTSCGCVYASPYGPDVTMFSSPYLGSKK